MTPPAHVQERRAAEFEAAKSRQEIEQLERRWAAEDRVVAEAETWRAKALDAALSRISELEQRLAAVERQTKPGGSLARAIVDAVGDVMAEANKRIDQLEQRPSMNYQGVHDEVVEYSRGDVVTCAGAAWIALAKVKGRPGKAADWRLMVKSSDQKGPGA
jgi:hypothetical protein